MKKNKIFLSITTVIALNLSSQTLSCFRQTNIENQDISNDLNKIKHRFSRFIKYLTCEPKGIFLHIANNDIEKIKIFIEKNKNNQKKINLTNKINKDFLDPNQIYTDNLKQRTLTPLLFAINQKKINITLLLLSANAIDIDMPDNDRKTPLQEACCLELITIIKNLIMMGAIVNKYDLFGNTALHYACNASNNFDIIELLLKNGANKSINKYNDSNETPLHIALKNDNLYFLDAFRIIKLLVSNGAIIDDKTIKIARNNQKNLQYLTMIKKYNNSENKITFISEKHDLLKKSYSKIKESLYTIYKELETKTVEKQFSEYLDKNLKLINYYNEKIKKNTFELLISFAFCKSMLEVEESHKPNIQENDNCKSFESTDFYKYYTKLSNKGKKEIEQILLTKNTDNLYEFVINAAEKNNCYIDKKFWTKFAIGSKILENIKISDCKIKFIN